MMARSVGSRMPMVVFTTLVLGTCGSVFYAHYQQRTEKQQMRQGVIRDIKRDRIKKRMLEEEQKQRQQE